ncbi:hypothetical protein CORC01_10519 [Colletotrichum orchidophilum]|uniref:Ankyrin repeat protein n=1 Tax=Colletotrichum orchidophilum TaxID=1209926 RepID=A0A1G4AYH1_9PEZI|nr:uncharacterized protein CORC01_10519 [Colletotrichum orchidophilum]OHE94181.1 hypothetical protein CORC01_10519 [Colletotrichum orchidophilum]
MSRAGVGTNEILPNSEIGFCAAKDTRRLSFDTKYSNFYTIIFTTTNQAAADTNQQLYVAGAAHSVMTNLRDLPPELKIAIVNELGREKPVFPKNPPINHRCADIQIAALGALALTDRFFNCIVTPLLYENGVLRHPYLLCWATDIGNVNIMHKALRTGMISPNNAIIRYQTEYQPWNPKTESSKELFWRFYRRDGQWFQSPRHYVGRLFEAQNPYEISSSEDVSEDDQSEDMERSLTSGDSSEDASVTDDYSDGEDLESEEDAASDAETDAADGLLPQIAAVGSGADSDAASDTDSESDEAQWRLDKRNIMFEGYLRFPDYDDMEDVDNRDIRGMYWMPIHIAARAGNMQVLELLLEFNALVNVSSKGFCYNLCTTSSKAIYWPDENGTYPAWTPLHVALCHGHTNVAKRIIDECEHLQERLLCFQEAEWQSLPRFISAIRHHHMGLAEWCLQQGSVKENVNAMNIKLHGATMLWRAFWEADDSETFEAALRILLRNGADIDHDLGKGHTLLMEACLYGYFEEAIALIKAGANVEITLDDFNIDTPLGQAWDDLHSRFPFGVEGCSLLEICCGPPPVLSSPWRGAHAPFPRRVNSEVLAPQLIRLLLESPARSVGKRDPLQIACYSHNKTAISTLLQSGMDITSVSIDNLTPLECATLLPERFSPQDWLHTFQKCMEKLTKHLVKRPKSEVKPAGNAALRNIMDSFSTVLKMDISKGQVSAGCLVTLGLADVNMRDTQDRTLLINLFVDGFYQEWLATKLLKLGARIERRPGRDDLAAIWSEVGINDELSLETFERSKEAYKFLTKIDKENRFRREPFFLAVAMAANNQYIVDSMLRHIQLDTLWITYPEGPQVSNHIPIDQVEGRTASSSGPGEVTESSDASSDIESDRGHELCDCENTIHRGPCERPMWTGPRDGLLILRERYSGWSLFHLAIRFGQLNVVTKLLKRGANVHERTDSGWSPGYIICSEQCYNSRILIHLLAHGVNPHIGGHRGWTSPLDHALSKGNLEAAKLMIKAYPLEKSPAARNHLYLHRLIHSQIKCLQLPMTTQEVLPIFARLDAAANAVDGDGNTPLGYLLIQVLDAKKKGNLSSVAAKSAEEMMVLLIKHGARAGIVNKAGKSVLDLMEEVRGYSDPLVSVRRFLRSTLLYHVMAYRKSIDMPIRKVVPTLQSPPSIDGAVYRIFIDYVFQSRNGKDIWIDGDGAANAWRIFNGVGDFRQQFVRIPRFNNAGAARTPLWGTYRNPFVGDLRVV